MLSLPDDLRKRLVDELRYAVTQMSEAQAPNERIYYFSVFFGEAVRVLNWHWDRELALIWSVVQHTHNAITQRVSQMGQGERVVTLSKEFFDAWANEATTLVDYLDSQGSDTELIQILGRFAELTYATTGNGFYLLTKGHLTFEN